MRALWRRLERLEGARHANAMSAGQSRPAGNGESGAALPTEAIAPFLGRILEAVNKQLLESGTSPVEASWAARKRAYLESDDAVEAGNLLTDALIREGRMGDG